MTSDAKLMKLWIIRLFLELVTSDKASVDLHSGPLVSE